MQRLVLDINIFVSALLLPHSLPAELVRLWIAGQVIVLSADAQIDEIARVTRYPKVRERLRPATAGRLINPLRGRASLLTNLPQVDVSPDPYDNYLLAMADIGRADMLVTGDKRDLLALTQYASAAIVSVRTALDRLQGNFA